MTGIRNWRRAFFILLGSVLIAVIALIGLIMNLLLSEPITEPEIEGNENVVTPFFTLSSTKPAINSWIKEELAKREQLVENINYEVLLEDYIYLRGGLEIFNREIPFQMVFHPIVNEDGGLTLQEKEISLGRLQLPGEVVLTLIQDQIDFPKWVEVHPQDHVIIVNVTDIKLQEGMELSVKKFDLTNDQLEFVLKR